MTIADLLGRLDWLNALLGAGVSAGLTIPRVGLRTLLNRRPLRRFIGQLADDKLVLSVFVRDMVSVDGKYYSQLPSGGTQQWQNLNVVGQEDVIAASNVLNLLGQAGRSANIEWRDIARDWDLWSEPLVCVGGSFKADKVLALCEPRYVRFDPPQAFVTMPDGRRFEADAHYDYGLIYRSSHPQTNRACLALFGFGSAGTLAAGSFFRRQASALARLYGDRPFAAIVRVGWHDGRDSGALVWLSPSSVLAPVLHHLTWRRHRKLIASKSAS